LGSLGGGVVARLNFSIQLFLGGMGELGSGLGNDELDGGEMGGGGLGSSELSSQKNEK
jgi:hypothetical protein